MIILNEPKDDYDYEFTVVKIVNMEKEVFEFVAHYDSIFDDAIYPSEKGYLVLHDVRISHKRKKKEYKVC